jgi:hypothetical protein
MPSFSDGFSDGFDIGFVLMGLVLRDRTKETTTTTGTVAVTLAGAAGANFQTFLAAVGDGNRCYYAIVSATQWEVGIGTYTAAGNTLSRDTVLASSNAGALVNFTAGSKDVYVDIPAGVVWGADNVDQGMIRKAASLRF